MPIFRKSAEAFAKAWQGGEFDKARTDANKAWSEGPFPENADPHNALFARNREDEVLGGLFETIAIELFEPLYSVTQKQKVNS